MTRYGISAPDPTPVPKLAYTLREAAQATGISEWTLRRLIRQGHLRRVPHYGHIAIPVAELERFLNGQEVAS